MESDLSLLEISGEDDSLLQNDDVSSLNKTYFSCSPLHFSKSKPPRFSSRRSPIEGVKGNEEVGGKPSSSSHGDSANKENICMNKSEVPKLNMEPQQMKRKKKGGGYNLRKSLAWDRAFFTEEGVLNSLELSMISGNFSKSGGEMLPIIEEGRESLSGVVDCASDSADMQALEGKLFKESPTTTSSVNGDRKIGGTSLPKHNSPARNIAAPSSTAKRKVLASHDLNRSGSKRSGCPRPVASSSLKRPAIVNTTKAANKEPKVSKILASKPNLNVLSTTAKSAMPGASQSKRNQIAQPAVNVQKKVGLKGTFNNIKNAQTDANSGAVCKPFSKSSVQQARRNVVRSASEINSSTNSQHSLVKKTNNGLKVNPDPVLPAPGHALNGHKGGSSKTAVTLCQTASSIRGNMQNAPLQTSKPSGLRMPSPSLGFFGQSRVSASDSLLPRSTQPCNLSKSRIPDVRKPGALNPIHEKPPSAPGQLSEVVNDVIRSGNMRVAGSSMGCSVSSTFNSSSHEKMKADMHVYNMQKVEVKLPYNHNSYEMINNQQKLRSMCNDFGQQSLEHGDPCKSENVFHVEEKELQSNDKNLLLQSGICEHLKKDVDNERAANVCPKGRDLIGTEVQNPHFTSHLSPITQVKSIAGPNDMVENQKDVFTESQSCDANSYTTQRTSNVIDNWLSSAHDVKEQAGLMKPRNCEDWFSNEESQMLCINDGTVFKQSGSSEELRDGESILSSSAVDNHQQTVLPNSCLVADQVFQNNYTPQLNDCLLHGECFSSEESQQENVLQSSKSVVPEKTDVRGSELDNSSALCLIPPALQDCGSDVAEMECLHVKDALSGFADSESQQENVLQSCKSVVPEKTDVRGSELDSSSALCLIPPATQDCGSDVAEMVECLHVKDALSGSADSESQQENVLQSSKSVVPEETDVRGSGLGSSSALCLIPPTTQDCGFDVAEMVEWPHVKDALSGSADSESQQENVLQSSESVVLEKTDVRESGLDSSSALCLIVPATQDGGSDVAGMVECPHVKDSLPGSVDSEKRVEKYNYVIDIHDTEPHSQATSWESERMDEDQITGAVTECNIEVIDVCQSSGDFRGAELEISHCISQLCPAVQVKVGSGINDMIEHKNVEDKQYDSHCAIFELQSGDDISYCQQDASAVGNDWLSGTHDVNKESMEHAKLIKSSSLEADKASREENWSPEAYHGLLFEESKYFEESGKFNAGNTADISPEVKGSCGRGLQSPHGLFELEIGEEANGANNMIKTSLVEDAKMQSLDGSLPVDSCNLNTSVANDKSSVNDENEQLVEDANMQLLDDSLLVDSCKINTSLANDKSSMVVNDENEQPGEHPQIQNLGLLVEQGFFDNQRSGLDEELLLARNISSEDLLDGNVLGSVGEPRSSIVCTELALEMQDGGSDVNKEAYLPVEDPISGCVEIEPSGENLECHIDMKFRHDDELDGQATSFEFNSSSVSEDQTSDKAVGSLNKESGSLINQTSSVSALQGESNVLESDILSQEAETNISPNSSSPNSEMQYESAKQMHATVQLKKSGNDKKQNNLVIKPPLHAVPFSEEWLAALEAAGEEVLTRKSGAVQHSPPDKSLPEPSPWSPVRRKNNQGIGPFDCTKFTNTNIPPSSSN